jgi:hypothetical protein
VADLMIWDTVLHLLEDCVPVSRDSFAPMLPSPYFGALEMFTIWKSSLFVAALTLGLVGLRGLEAGTLTETTRCGATECACEACGCNGTDCSECDCQDCTCAECACDTCVYADCCDGHNRCDNDSSAHRAI